MPASQLSQLKAALSGAGLNRKSTSKKDQKAFKKGGAREVDRQKKFDKLEDIRRGLNKFDERETRVKHDVGGRRLTGVTGRPSAAKQAGLERRLQNLLPEHQLRHHTGTFNDRRFGENNPTLTAEERELERYTRERQKGQGKKGMFNLEEEEEDDIFGFEEEGGALGGLTHGGRSVSELKRDDFEMQGLGDEDDEAEDEKGVIGKKTVERGHFGGFTEGDEEEQGGERKKSRQEVMAEVIAKSKEHKHARQQQAEIDAEMREALDADMNDLQALLQTSIPARAPRPTQANPDAPVAGPSRMTTHPDRQAIIQRDEEKEYDQFVRELAFEARAKPKDRTKTEDELAIEEKQQLEAAEAKRLRRMRGEESDEDEDSAGGRRKRRKDARGDADDLDDDFVDEDDLLGPGLTREDIENMSVPSDMEDDEEDDEGSDEDEDEEEDDEDDESEASSMADLDDEAPELLPVEDDVDMQAETVKGKKKRDAAAKSVKSSRADIPFTFPCPSTIEELEDILEPLDDSAVPTVIQRIRALHHPSLAQGNKEKLQDFLGVLLDYVLILASRPSVDGTTGFKTISLLQPHLIALVKLNPISAAHSFLSKLTLMQKNLTRGLARGANLTESKTWPGASELALLRIVGKIWSTSDFSHPVVAPAVLLIGQYLSQARVRCLGDLASGLFLCSILAQYEEESKRIIPEALNFLGSAILTLLPRRKDIKPFDPYPEARAPSVNLALTGASSSAKAHREPVNLLECLDNSSTAGSGSATSESEQCKADLLGLALRQVSIFANMYSSHEAFIELLSPIRRILEDSRVTKLHESLRNLHSTTLSTLGRQLNFATTARIPLAMQSHKPVPIATHLPKFEADFVPGKSYDPDAERAESHKLKALYKKEKKGAIRELRKDNRFLAGVKAAEQREKDAGYLARMRKVEGSLEKERAEEKSMERDKKREKMRAGRK